MTTIEEFTRNIEKELEEVKPGTLNPDTHYRDIPEWSSMYALIIIAYIDTEYEITLSGDDLRSCQTIRDLYNLIKSRTQ